MENQGRALDGGLAAVVADVSPLARAAYAALCAAKRRSLTHGSLARKVGVGRWKPHSYAALSAALNALVKIGLVSSDGQRYTAVCERHTS